MTAMTPDTDDQRREPTAAAQPESTATEPRADPTTGQAPAEAGPAQAVPAEAQPELGTGGLHVGVHDRCANCGAELALDQRYCVECGTRRGGPRFTLATQALATTSSASSSPSTVSGRSADARLVALLALITVLLALGVGVLIGDAVSGTTTGTTATHSSTTKSGGAKTSTQSQHFFGG